MKHKKLAFFLSLFSGLAGASQNPFVEQWNAHRFYFGSIVGYGSTDWNMMVMKCGADHPFCSADTVGLSAPLDADGDSGMVWGATIGYEVKPSWAIETSYMRFPATSIKLGDTWNFYMEENHNTTQFSSETWAMFAVAKFMTQIANTGFRGYANAGIDFTARNDVLTDTIHVNPTFGLGINYVFPSNFMLELGFQYMAGYGAANEVPADNYIPFLYSIAFKLLYRI